MDNTTYDVIYAPAEKDNPEKFVDWAIWEEDLPFESALEVLTLAIEGDFLPGAYGSFAYRIVLHGEWGDVI